MARSSIGGVWRQVMRLWRMAAAGATFALFGFGGLLLGFVAIPLVGAFVDEGRAQRRCRRTIHLAFRLFMAWIAFVGLARCDVKGASQLRNAKGTLVVANHPTLIDVIVLVSHLRDAYCVVKEEVWRSPFYGRVVRAAGYIPNIRADDVVERAAALVRSGEVVVLFPEGTRTPPGEQPVVRRGAALVLLRARAPALPVRLDVRPTVLTKGHSLLRFPGQRVLFEVMVGDPLWPESFAAGPSERVSAQAGARLLQDVLRDERRGLTV